LTSKCNIHRTARSVSSGNQIIKIIALSTLDGNSALQCTTLLDEEHMSGETTSAGAKVWRCVVKKCTQHGRSMGKREAWLTSAHDAPPSAHTKVLRRAHRTSRQNTSTSLDTWSSFDAVFDDDCNPQDSLNPAAQGIKPSMAWSNLSQV